MPKILICDDDPGIRDLLSLTLSLDHDVVTVEDGARALQYLAEVDGDVDVLLLDVMMPVLDGFDTLTRLRESPSTADLPVLMLTARVGEADHVRGYECGADAYLSKPFDPADLDEAIAAVLSRTPAERRIAREGERSRAALLRQLESRFG